MVYTISAYKMTVVYIRIHYILIIAYKMRDTLSGMQMQNATCVFQLI